MYIGAGIDMWGGKVRDIPSSQLGGDPLPSPNETYIAFKGGMSVVYLTDSKRGGFDWYNLSFIDGNPGGFNRTAEDAAEKLVERAFELIGIRGRAGWPDLYATYHRLSQDPSSL